MSLPGEIRNAIYDMVLDDEAATSQDQTIVLGRHPQSTQPSRPTRPPGLLETSHQIRREAMERYYDSNVFQLAVNAQHLPQVAGWLMRYRDVCGVDKIFEGVSFQAHISKKEEVYLWFFITRLIMELTVEGDFSTACVRWVDFFEYFRNVSERYLPLALVQAGLVAARRKETFAQIRLQLQRLAFQEIAKAAAVPTENPSQQQKLWDVVLPAMRRVQETEVVVPASPVVTVKEEEFEFVSVR